MSLDIDKVVAAITDEVYSVIAHETAARGESISATGAADIVGYIEHTLIRSDATKSQIVNLCNEAKDNRFASV